MANEIELSNVVHQTDVVASMITGPFVNNDMTFPVILTEPFPDTTNVILFPKSGKVEAGTQAESAAYSYGSDDEISDTSTSVTGAKVSQAQKISLENLRFGEPHANMQRYANEAANGLNRLAAADLKTLFSSIANGVTATTTLTKDDILDARYNVVSNVKSGALSPKLVGWFDYKGMNELAKELAAVSADVFTQQVNLGGVLGLSEANGAKGELFDILLFETDGLPEVSSDDTACVWDPALAFCAGIDNTGFQVEIEKPTAAQPWVGLFVYTFWKIAEHNDTAACRVRSDT